MISVYIILFLAALCSVLAVIIYAQAQGVKKAKQESAALHEAFWDAARKAEGLQEAMKKQTEAEVRANEERQDLAGTANADLVKRANSLFGGGMPDKSGPGGASGNKT